MMMIILMMQRTVAVCREMMAKARDMSERGYNATQNLTQVYQESSASKSVCECNYETGTLLLQCE